jgi:ATP-binding cassette, subfamily B, bacterial HlyB/CyaB
MTVAAQVVTVGAVPLEGQPDHDSVRVTAALAAAGVPVTGRLFVDDDETALERAVRVDDGAPAVTVLIAGGDGSAGDIVRRVLARVTGARLVLNERMLGALEERHRRLDRPMPRRAERLALLPQGATVWVGDDGEPAWALATERGAWFVFANKLVDAATVVSGTVSQLLQDASGFESTSRALAVRPVKEIHYGERDVDVVPPTLEIDAVSFAHAGQVVLDECSFKVGGGELVAIVGASGTGKSTLALILSGLYHPDRGVVRIAGVPLTEHRREHLVRAIGFQPQEARLVEGTVRDNLLYGLAGAPGDVAIETVLRGAHLEDLLERKDLELDAGVGERGASLSGGERQRVAFARILLRDPAILVLDEITSALDPSTEDVLLDTLVGLRGRKTVVFITHRLRSAAIADRILVLEAGRIVEEGTFEALRARHGAFARLARRDRVEDVLA